MASPKAAAVWQWYNYTDALAAARGKTLLRINIDETSVCLHPGGGRGAVFASRKWLRNGGGQHVPKWKQRRYMSHVAVMCDRIEVQTALPQFVIGNRSTLQLRHFVALRRSRPMNVRLIRRSTAWNTARLTACLIHQIADALAGSGVLSCDVQVVVLLDAARIHFAPEVLRACKAVHFWLIVVPARMTFLLQPLDTHVFAVYKARLQRAYQSARTRSHSTSGDLSIDEFLQCIDHAIRSALEERSWASAFDSDGFGDHQRMLGCRVRRALQLDVCPVIPSSRPSDDQLRHCFPRRARPSFASLWALFEEPSTPAPLPPLVHRSGDDGLVPIHGAAPAGALATRSRRRLETADHAVLRFSPGSAGVPPLLRRYRRPPDLD